MHQGVVHDTIHQMRIKDLHHINRYFCSEKINTGTPHFMTYLLNNQLHFKLHFRKYPKCRSTGNAYYGTTLHQKQNALYSLQNLFKFFKKLKLLKENEIYIIFYTNPEL